MRKSLKSLCGELEPHPENVRNYIDSVTVGTRKDVNIEWVIFRRNGELWAMEYEWNYLAGGLYEDTVEIFPVASREVVTTEWYKVENGDTA